MRPKSAVKSGVDPNRDYGHSVGVTKRPSQIQLWLFGLVAAVWLVTAIPIALISLLFLEIPLWPTFSSESTVEGTMVWAVMTGWFYITPVVLLIIGRRWNGQSTS